MQNTTVIAAPVNAIDQEIFAATEALGKHETTGYGLNIRLGKAINAKFDYDWFDLSGTDTSDQGKMVRAEKKLFVERLKAMQHKNPSQSWLRVRAAARDDRHPKPAVQVAEQGESGASHNRSPKLRFVEELSALYKFGHRQDDLDNECRAALVDIASALTKLKVNLSMLDSK